MWFPHTFSTYRVAQKSIKFQLYKNQKEVSAAVSGTQTKRHTVLCQIGAKILLKLQFSKSEKRCSQNVLVQCRPLAPWCKHYKRAAAIFKKVLTVSKSVFAVQTTTTSRWQKPGIRCTLAAPCYFQNKFLNFTFFTTGSPVNS